MNKMLSVVLLGASLVLAGCGNDRKVVIVDQVEHQREVVYVERENGIGVGEVLATALLVDALTNDRDYDRYDDRRGDTTIVNNTTVVKNTTVDNKKRVKLKKVRKLKLLLLKRKLKLLLRQRTRVSIIRKSLKQVMQKLLRRKRVNQLNVKRLKLKNVNRS